LVQEVKGKKSMLDGFWLFFYGLILGFDPFFEGFYGC